MLLNKDGRWPYHVECPQWTVISLDAIAVSDLIEQLYTKADQRDFDTVPRVELDMSEKEIASKTEVMMSGTGPVRNDMCPQNQQ